MRFWDSSAVIPILLNEPRSEKIKNFLAEDQHMVVWWATIIECWSAISRLCREGYLTDEDENRVREILQILVASWTEIEPTAPVKQNAARLIKIHPLRAADSLQLAAAMVWAQGNPTDSEFVCLDERLRRAVNLEGFKLAPGN